MSSVNRAILIGNLGKDPEVRRTQDAKPIVTFSVATSERWRDKATGERRETTDWHNVVIFNEGLAKVAEQYLKKGSKVYLEGAIKTRKWTDSNGATPIERYTTEIVLGAHHATLVMLDRSERAPAADESAYGPAPAPTAPKRNDMDDEIPF